MKSEKRKTASASTSAKPKASQSAPTGKGKTQPTEQSATANSDVRQDAPPATVAMPSGNASGNEGVGVHPTGGLKTTAAIDQAAQQFAQFIQAICQDNWRHGLPILKQFVAWARHLQAYGYTRALPDSILPVSSLPGAVAGLALFACGVNPTVMFRTCLYLAQWLNLAFAQDAGVAESERCDVIREIKAVVGQVAESLAGRPELAAPPPPPQEHPAAQMVVAGFQLGKVVGRKASAEEIEKLRPAAERSKQFPTAQVPAGRAGNQENGRVRAEAVSSAIREYLNKREQVPGETYPDQWKRVAKGATKILQARPVKLRIDRDVSPRVAQKVCEALAAEAIRECMAELAQAPAKQDQVYRNSVRQAASARVGFTVKLAWVVKQAARDPEAPK